MPAVPKGWGDRVRASQKPKKAEKKASKPKEKK